MAGSHRDRPSASSGDSRDSICRASKASNVSVKRHRHRLRRTPLILTQWQRGESIAGALKHLLLLEHATAGCIKVRQTGLGEFGCYPEMPRQANLKSLAVRKRSPQKYL